MSWKAKKKTQPASLKLLTVKNHLDLIPEDLRLWCLQTGDTLPQGIINNETSLRQWFQKKKWPCTNDSNSSQLRPSFIQKDLGLQLYNWSQPASNEQEPLARLTKTYSSHVPSPHSLHSHSNKQPLGLREGQALLSLHQAFWFKLTLHSDFISSRNVFPESILRPLGGRQGVHTVHSHGTPGLDHSSLITALQGWLSQNAFLLKKIQPFHTKAPTVHNE